MTRSWLLVAVPPALAVIAACTVNLAAYGRISTAPFGNVFLLARVIYDGPGMAVLRRDCPTVQWRLCPFLGRFPPTSDDFLWDTESPLRLAGGPKLVSSDAGAIITAALLADPAGEVRAALGNTLEQLTRFASGDGLVPWPAEVSPWIEQDFPPRERAAYASARQQTGTLSVPSMISWLHTITALGGVIVCVILLPVAFRRRGRLCRLPACGAGGTSRWRRDHWRPVRPARPLPGPHHVVCRRSSRRFPWLRFAPWLQSVPCHHSGGRQREA